MKPLTYLACPYSDPNPQVREARYRAVCRVAAEMVRHGEMVFSPIAYGHPLVKHGVPPLPGTWEYWEDIDREWLKRSDHVLVLMLPGWERSVGIKGEMDIAADLSLPITRIEFKGFGDCVLCGVRPCDPPQLFCADCDYSEVPA